MKTYRGLLVHYDRKPKGFSVATVKAKDEMTAYEELENQNVTVIILNKKEYSALLKLLKKAR